jgi:hypothetical protein
VDLSVKESEPGSVVKKNSLIENCWYINGYVGNKEKLKTVYRNASEFIIPFTWKEN